jgi:hypothetical protein
VAIKRPSSGHQEAIKRPSRGHREVIKEVIKRSSRGHQRVPLGAHPGGNRGGTAGGNVMFVVFTTPVTFTFTVISVAKLTFVPLPNMELVGGGVLTSV